jgi:glycosyl transferase family 25
LTDNSLLICGGQNGLASRKWLFVKKKSDFYEVSPASYGNIFRTCCYVVTRSSAIAILKRHEKMVTLADKWSEFFVGTDINIYYVDLFDHPEDLSQSTIEWERSMQKDRRSILKYSSEKYRRFIKFLLFVRDYSVGYRRMIF